MVQCVFRFCIFGLISTFVLGGSGCGQNEVLQSANVPNAVEPNFQVQEKSENELQYSIRINSMDTAVLRRIVVDLQPSRFDPKTLEGIFRQISNDFPEPNFFNDSR